MLRQGDTFVVPRGTEHKPSSPGGSILMFEPRGTSSTGDRHEGEIPEHVESTTGHAPRPLGAGVTKSISSSTRPMSAGSRSFQSRTRPRIRCHALAMSACWAVRPAQRLAHAVLPVHAARNHRPRRDAEPARLDRLPDVDERMADDQRVLAAGAAADGVGDAGLLGAGHQVVDEHAEPTARARAGTPRRCRRDRRRRRGIRRPRPRPAGRRPTPARPVRRRAGPRRRSGWPARPSPCACTATEPDAVRAGAAGAARRGGGQDHRLAVDQVAGSDRERFPAAVPVLEFHPAVLDADHRADVTGLGVLDDHADFHRPLGANGAFGAGCWRGRRRHSDQPPGDRRVTPVLLNRDTAEGIANGSITLVLRRWDAPRANAGWHSANRRGHDPHRRRRRAPGELPGNGRAGARRGLSGRQDRTAGTRPQAGQAHICDHGVLPCTGRASGVGRRRSAVCRRRRSRSPPGWPVGTRRPKPLGRESISR